MPPCQCRHFLRFFLRASLPSGPQPLHLEHGPPRVGLGKASLGSKQTTPGESAHRELSCGGGKGFMLLVR